MESKCPDETLRMRGMNLNPCILRMLEGIVSFDAAQIVKPRYLELAYFELPLVSKWKSGPCFNMKLWQQVTK